VAARILDFSDILSFLCIYIYVYVYMYINVKNCSLSTTYNGEMTHRKQQKQEFVPPRWPYDMRPSVRAEKYIRDASG